MSDPPKVCSKCGESYSADVIFCPKDGAPLGTTKTQVVDDPYLGLTLQGQFRIEQFIGIGSMGRVYRAHQDGIDRDVAIKILHRELTKNDQVLARFQREARVSSRLVHPNVVQVLMTGVVERDAERETGGEAYLVMEFLDGISLRSALAAAGGALPIPRALHVTLQVCDAVGEAHAQGVVHRDLKPENVMLVRRGDDDDFVKVLDFGVARLDWGTGTVATQTGAIFGTARYISPEGAEGGTATARSDVYSIATILFQCLAGQTPFDADNPVGILVKHTSEPAPDIRSIARASYVPEPIARVVTANLSKDPRERCRDARDLGRALVHAANQSGLSTDDLVLRATLLGGSRGALQLQSMERTKQLHLTPELSAQMAGKTEVPDEDAPEDRASAPGSDVVSAPRASVPPSSVEPTLTDEPAEGVHGGHASTRPSYPTDASSRTSLPPIPLGSSEGGAARRALIVVVCFVVGAGVSLIVARSLGVFDNQPDELTVDQYEERARAALAGGRWDSPPGENVNDLTSAALQRWPGAPRIVAVKRDAAKGLAQRAAGLAASEATRSDARATAELALRFDPDNEAARAVLAKLDRAEESVDEPRRADSNRPVGSRRAPSGGRAAPSGTASADEPPESVDADRSPTPPAPASAGGRWL